MRVQLAKMPGAINNFMVEDNATVQDLLTVAGVSHVGFTISIDGNPADLSTELDDNATVVLAKQVKGN